MTQNIFFGKTKYGSIEFLCSTILQFEMDLHNYTLAITTNQFTRLPACIQYILRLLNSEPD